MSMRNPPPVGSSAVQAPDRNRQVTPRRSTAEQNFLTVQEAMRGNTGDARAIRAMFGGDKKLMERFLSVAFSLLAKESRLLEDATPMSIIEAIKEAASMGLEPLGPSQEGAIVHHKGIAQFRPMYRGYLKRIRNSGKVVDIDCQLVYENDDFALEFGTNPAIYHRPARTVKDGQTGAILEDRGGYRGVYAWALMPSGKYVIEWMEEAEINKVRDNHGSKKDGVVVGPWVTDYGEMARKTVLRRLGKRLPQEAVAGLLEADTKADTLEQELKQEQDSHIEDLRMLAMRATGVTPVDVPAEPVAAPVQATEALADQPASDPLQPLMDDDDLAPPGPGVAG